MSRKARVVLAASLSVFAAYCYLSNLSGAVILNSDENRAYHFQLFTPLLYFVSHFLIHLFKSTDAPFYLQGVTGLASIALTVWIVRRTLSPAAAWIAAVFMILYDYPLAYSKMLYYTNLHYFFITASTAVYLQALRRDGWLLYLMAGSLAGAMVVVNASGVIPMAFLFLFFIAAHRLSVFDRPRTSFLTASGALGAGMVLTYVLFEGWLAVWYAIHPSLERIWFFQVTRDYGSATPLVYQLGPAYAADQILAIARQALSPWEGGWFRSALVLTAVAGGMGLALKRRSIRPAFWGILLILGGAVVLLLACLKAQPFYPRTLIWTVLPIAALTAYAVESAWRSSRGASRVAVGAVLAVYVLFGVQKCLALTHSLPSVDPILRYLDDHGIAKTRVASLFHIDRYEDLYTEGGVHKAADPPVLVINHPRVIAEGRSHLLHWPLIRSAYQQGKIEYLLIPGMYGLLSRVGERDPLLSGLTPKAEWDHQLSNRHLNGEPIPIKVRLYDLKEVFAKPGANDYVDRMDGDLRSLAGK